MGVVGLLGLLVGSFAILSASVSSESSPQEYSAADGETPALIFEVEHLKGKTARLKGKLEDLRVLVEEERRLRAEKAEEAAGLRRRLGDVEVRLTRVESAAKALEGWKGRTEGRLGWTSGVTTENVSTALVVNAPAWELGGPTGFNVSQAMGGWHQIEEFLRGCRPSPLPCQEYIFNFTGSTVGRTRRWRKSGDRRELKDDLTVDSLSPHQWSDGRWTWTWVTTDYANWAVLLWCHKELSSCLSLRILSRERTLPPATLEMLRNVAEQRGFPQAHGALVNQTPCGSEAEENATLKWTKEVTTENASTALRVNAAAWGLGGQTAFNVSQAMGGWHQIEEFLRGCRPSPRPCQEYIFNFTGSTVGRTRRWGKSSDRGELKDDLTVDSLSPHQWSDDLWTYKWVTTDYANWAVLLWCHRKELSSCWRLFILSRELTLPPATLEMLRNVAEQRGFPKAHGALEDQTSC